MVHPLSRVLFLFSSLGATSFPFFLRFHSRFLDNSALRSFAGRFPTLLYSLSPPFPVISLALWIAFFWRPPSATVSLRLDAAFFDILQPSVVAS